LEVGFGLVPAVNSDWFATARHLTRSSACGSGPAAKAPSTGCRCWPEIKNRGVEDACMVVCDRRKRLTGDDRGDVALAIVQTCVLHLIRRTPSGSSVGLTGTRWPAISTRLHVPTLRG